MVQKIFYFSCPPPKRNYVLKFQACPPPSENPGYAPVCLDELSTNLKNFRPAKLPGRVSNSQTKIFFDILAESIKMPGIQVQKLMSSKAFWNYELQNFLGRLGTPNLV